jgi:hypothetical protein
VIPLKYHLVFGFSEGLAAVTAGNNKYGYISR